jgi:hypothetical protein
MNHHQLSSVVVETSSVIQMEAVVGSSRALQGKGNNVPSASPSSTYATLSPAPSALLNPRNKATYGNDKDAAKGFGWFTIFIVLLIAVFVLWRLWIRYRRHAEQRMLDFRSAQADRVLGDMQMVPNADLDNDLI